MKRVTGRNDQGVQAPEPRPLSQGNQGRGVAGARASQSGGWVTPWTAYHNHPHSHRQTVLTCQMTLT